jgi:thiamine biosynthesis lipoprotein
VGWGGVRFSKDEVFLPDIGMEIDFGGVVKEYAVDAALALLKKRKVEGALVDLAGDIGAFSNDSGTPWDIGIKNPRSPERAVATVQIANSALASSGDYERCIVIGDRLANEQCPSCCQYFGPQLPRGWQLGDHSNAYAL